MDDATTDFRAVLETEYGWVRARRSGAAPKLDAAAKPPENLAGLALSGGGIRSASFCMGALQALHKHGLFQPMDYLSTVSGGGYVGAAVTADYDRRAAASTKEAPDDAKRIALPIGLPLPVPAATPSDFGLAQSEGAAGGLYGDSPLVRHIRDHGNFLAPHGFRDVLTSLAILARGLVVNAVITASLMILAAILVAPVYRTTLCDVVISEGGGGIDEVAGPGGPVIEPRVSKSLAATWWSGTATDCVSPPKGPLPTALAWSDAFPVTLVAVGLFAAFCVVWALVRSWRESRNDGVRGLGEPDSRAARGAAVAMVLVAGIVVVEAIGPLLNAVALPDLTSVLGDFEVAILPILAGSGLVGAFWQRLAGLIGQARTDPRWSAAIKAVTAKALLLAAALAVPLLLFAAFLELVAAAVVRTPPAGWPAVPNGIVGGVPLAVGVVGAVVTVARFGLAARRHRANGDPLRPGPAAVVAAGVVALPIVFGVVVLRETCMTGPQWQVWRDLAGLGTVLTVAAYFFTPNASSLHRLYRDRLAVAFDITPTEPPPDGGRLQADGERLTFARLRDHLAKAPRATGPFPIVNATINVPGSSTVNRRGRNADIFTFTPTHVGSEATGWVPTAWMEAAERQLDLATAAAISGAAVSSSMGRVGIPMLAFTLALFNVRLGFWLRNPRALREAAGGGRKTAAKPTRDPETIAARASRDDWRLPYLGAEMFNRLDEKRARIYVTDGGHIENLGLYQLLKRRCAFVVVVDGEADPGLDCGAMVDAERFARIDEGIRIELPWEAIRDAGRVRRAARLKGELPPPGPKSAHAAVGRIRYSDGREPEEGVILYVKASLTGDENDYVLDYARRYPEFPHETTADQFFSEEQMEAYRALGFHAMDHALSCAADAGQAVLLNRLRMVLGATGAPAVVVGAPAPAPVRRSRAARPAPVPGRDRPGR
ncbi:patatin-like phospholipase family protein [Oharaeibacter diazotrophicus]|uniref:Patatin-like phospholipase n=2 Tax=Oharaeibacter diazotrophicus TaxID=1920512 RepID=A0A4R6R967_9HYPH|nr:patatin-like phospholipase family protein [Oharaeibacter diazotrophicus]TDP82600.1 patatin-like phospholipase [Oharaeibacter diazotrophicus]BBE72636.1 patatin-like phospholipase [Pleomorphomonas sp. SM30]GLS76670.1 hypothetical protein GCM10007904_20070 [Oharaeibacter diazotrophicus]